MLIEWHLMRHMKTGKAGEGQNDRDRIANDVGLSQIQELQTALKQEGTVFDIIVHSAVLRTEQLANVIKNDATALVPLPGLYFPDLNSTIANERIDAAVIWAADPFFGYDLEAWFNNDIVALCAERRMKSAAREIMRDHICRFETNRDTLVVGVVGHFFFLHELAAQIASRRTSFSKRFVPLQLRSTELKECDRLVIVESLDSGYVGHQHVPLGKTMD